MMPKFLTMGGDSTLLKLLQVFENNAFLTVTFIEVFADQVTYDIVLQYVIASVTLTHF